MTLDFPDILTMRDEDATWFSVYPTAYTWAAAPMLAATELGGRLEYMLLVGGGSDIDLPDIDLPPGFFDYMLQNPASAMPPLPVTHRISMEILQYARRAD
jgi:hypothetical protein